MNEPTHWLQDGAPADFERLLSAARREEPASGGVERALVAAGIVGTTSLVTGTAAATAGTVVGKTLLGGATHWIAISVVSVGAVVVTAQVVEHGDAREPSRPAELAPRTK